MKTVVELQQNLDTGELVLPLSGSLVSELGWAEGDTLEWIDNGDGSFTIRKYDWRRYGQ